MTDAESAVFREIASERQNQIDKGFDADHDDQHVNGELSEFAAFLAWPGLYLATDTVFHRAKRIATKETRRQCLVVAAAMLIAEIQRLDRLP